MKKNLVGIVSSNCNTCYDIIGKGPGYDDVLSGYEAEKWLQGTSVRKEQLIREGKL